MPFNQEIQTSALRREAARALSHAAYIVEHKDAGIDEVRTLITRAMQAMEMALPVVGQGVVTLQQRNGSGQ